MTVKYRGRIKLGPGLLQWRASKLNGISSRGACSESARAAGAAAFLKYFPHWKFERGKEVGAARLKQWTRCAFKNLLGLRAGTSIVFQLQPLVFPIQKNI